MATQQLYVWFGIVAEGKWQVYKLQVTLQSRFLTSVLLRFWHCYLGGRANLSAIVSDIPVLNLLCIREHILILTINKAF